MNLFDLFARISLDTSEYEAGIEGASRSGESLAAKLKSGLGNAGKAIGSGIAAVGSAAGGAATALNGVAASTEEYRAAQGKLKTAFEAAGYDIGVAKQSYDAFYKILGDTDTATEASQRLANLATSAEDVSTWTDIAAGVSGTFGDSLPIEGLMESANQTAKVGQVTGSLADALSWAGVSEDEFNAKLAACSGETERNQLIMDTLSGTYDEASEAFYRNNEAIVQARENQALMDATMATLGGTVANVKNGLMSEFLPAMSNVVLAFDGLINGAAGSDQAFMTAIDGLVNQAVEKLPQFLAIGTSILTTIVQGIAAALPTLAAGAVQMIPTIMTAITGLLPTLLQAGIDVLLAIVNGISQNLPQLIPAAVDAVLTIIDTLVANIDLLITAGIDLLLGIATGLIDAIPQLTARVPEIISSLVQKLTEPGVLEQLISAALTLIVALAGGLIQAIPQLVSAIPSLVQSIVDGFANNVSNIIGIGSDIVNGIKSGIIGAWEDFTNWVTGKFDALLGGIKSFLGIQSPSKRFRDEIGKNIALGVAEGIDKNMDQATKAAESMAKEVYNQSVSWLDRNTKTQGFGLREQLEVWEAIQEQFIKESQQYADAEKEIYNLKKQVQDEYYKKVEEVNANISRLEEEYNTALASRTKEIFDSYALFDEIPERQAVSGDTLMQNLEGQMAAMEEFYGGLNELADRGVGDGLIEQIRALGPKAIDQLDALLKMGDDKLSEYSNLYEEKQSLANELATEELASLKDDTDKQIKENLNALELLYDQNAPVVGKAFTDGLAKGILDGMRNVVDAAKRVAQAAAQATRDEMGIHSPSTVFAAIGKNMALGMGKGWEGEIDHIASGISSSLDFGTSNVDFAASGLGVSSMGIVNGLSSAVSGAGGSGPTTINLMLPDNTKFASYLLPSLAKVAKANGTPIINPT